MSAIFDSPADALVASRILGHPHAYRRWEAEHGRLMRSVSAQTNVDRQVTALRSTALSLVHRKAMFDYLRDREITGRKRHRFFSLFYGSRDYVDRKSTRLNSSHSQISYAVFCLKKKKTNE